MTWILIDLDNGHEYPMSEGSKIKKYIDGLNEVTTKINADIPDDTYVKVVDHLGNVRFLGYTKRKDDASDDVNEYTILQKASILAKYPLLKLGEPWCTWSAVTVNKAVDDILDFSGCGWLRDALGGSSDTTVITNITFYYTDVLSGLFRLIQEYMDQYLWFDDINEYVQFGESRNDWTGTEIDYIHKRVETSSVGKGYDLVRVIGPNDSVMGFYGIHGGTAITFQRSEIANNWEATQLAIKLYRRIGTGGSLVNTPSKVTLTLAPTNKYEEGDKVTFEGIDYVIHQVTEQMDNTVIILNGAVDDISSIIEKKLSRPTYDSADASSGGFSNPATSDLDMNGYKIIASSGQNIEFQVSGSGVIKFTRV